MRQSEVYRTIYSELRITLGKEVPARDIARLARHMMRAYIEPEKIGPDFREAPTTREFGRQPIDHVLSSPSWRTLAYENHQQRFGGPDNALPFYIMRKINRMKAV